MRSYAACITHSGTASVSPLFGLFAVLIQGVLLTRSQIPSLEANVRTVIELREAGAFGTGGFGSARPIGA